ncbi:MAG: menaquinone biosynthesis protein [bacterium]
MKLGCVPYINALPLTHFLDPQKFEIITRPPAELLELLQNKRVDAALLPIVNYFETEHLYLVPHLAIASDGAVMSVKLFLKNPSHPIEKLKYIYLDQESRTSQLLLQSLLLHHFKRDLSQIVFLKDPKDPRAEAELLIGDKALDKQAAPFHDLGKLWLDYSRKPFVYAAWMTASPAPAGLKEALTEARNKGLENLSKIIESLPRYSPLLLKEYFTNAIRYYMGEAELEGVRAFYESLKPIQGYPHELHFRFVS